MSETFDLFPSSEPGPPPSAPEAAADVHSPDAPLASRMRPRSLAEFRGQEAVIGRGGPVRVMIDAGAVSSFILWGPPGSGKTTLAWLVAGSVDAAFVSFSAVTEGVARVREIIAEAKQRRAALGRGTVLFCDEIHRFNKGQQDAFLPHVEAGSVVLIGATTENPSFEIVRPLLSRAPVIVLEPLGVDDLTALLQDALCDADRGLGAAKIEAEAPVLSLIAHASDGDARRALGILERCAQIVGTGGSVTSEVVETAVQHRFAVYDKAGDQHYDHISALHKSIRGGDPDATLYWLARMLDAGEDPSYIARRMVRMAVEDIGLADPDALGVALAGRDGFRFLGSPEGELALAQAAVYLAGCPKSNRLYTGFARASKTARETGALPVPKHLRNAPTRLMKQLGHGKGYMYDPDQPDGVAKQSYLPEDLSGEEFYEPGAAGWEGEAALRMSEWRKIRRTPGDEPHGGG